MAEKPRRDPRDEVVDAVVLWRLDPAGEAKAVIDAAVQALLDGLDTPALRELAGASPKESTYVLEELIDRRRSTSWRSATAWVMTPDTRRCT
ncbi:hypothetical protein [Jiangella mangrovi]|uniref:Regulator of protease activity HflC (Stomatin/prohibitin superfamily) n=1 Tax=Jiangella mangrovi TaxID=1524084 RepID=A0A7W9LMR7_9ACTN|nr:hypothetical protein [Jiangella mangrovi]MBB5789536.1 regulator of protease activity HflC (stomatin/prohibitin superfamily) [Jiangella mangrovi]